MWTTYPNFHEVVSRCCEGIWGWGSDMDIGLLLKITLWRLSIFFASLFSVQGMAPYTQDGLIDVSARKDGIQHESRLSNLE